MVTIYKMLFRYSEMKRTLEEVGGLILNFILRKHDVSDCKWIHIVTCCVEG
jgi:hypothetical protein